MRTDLPRVLWILAVRNSTPTGDMTSFCLLILLDPLKLVKFK